MRGRRAAGAAFLVGALAASVALAIVGARSVLDLRELSDSVGQAGVAFDRTADALDSISGLPLVGDELVPIEREVRATASEAAAAAASSREDIGTLAVVLGVAIGVATALPLLTLALAWRSRRPRQP